MSSVEKSAGRPRKPRGEAQEEVIRCRCKTVIRDRYEHLGGKLWLIESINNSYRHYKTGRRVKATFRAILNGKEIWAEEFDVTHIALALGPIGCRSIADDSEIALSMAHGETVSERIRGWTEAGKFKVSVQESIKAYFAE